MHLVLGLGNPGRRYERTRHNVGFLVVDRLSQRWSAPCDRRQLGAEVGRARVGTADVVLAKPQSFMNLSGQPAASLRGLYKVAAEDVVVVHDEVDLPLGSVRVKRGGGDGGHRGLRDIIARCDNAFTRVRVGVSRPAPEQDTADYVLSPWTEAELDQLESLVDRAADAVEAIVGQGPVAAMNTFNTRERRPKPAPTPATSGGDEPTP